MKVAVHIHPIEERPGGADRVLLTIAEELSREHDVDLVSMGSFDLESAARLFDLDLSRVAVRHTWEGKSRARRALDHWLSRRPEGNRYRKMYSCATVSAISRDYDLFVNGESGDVAVNKASHGILYTFFPWTSAAFAGRRQLLHALYCAPYGLWHYFSPPRGQFTYELIVTLSDYSRSHIENRWHVTPELLYPCVDLSRFRPAEKSRSILTVGRFFRGSGHEKRFEVLCEHFRNRHAAGELAGWTLHVAGFAEDAGYVSELRETYADAPIVFHPNALPSELADLYAAASIYWHGAGFGQDLEHGPQRAEHFGIPVVEAMASGAIPIVFDAGGPPELIKRDRCGMVWKSLDDLSRATLQIATDGPLADRLRMAGLERAKDFSREAFGRKLNQLVGRVSPAAESAL